MLSWIERHRPAPRRRRSGTRRSLSLDRLGRRPVRPSLVAIAIGRPGVRPVRRWDLLTRIG